MGHENSMAAMTAAEPGRIFFFDSDFKGLNHAEVLGLCTEVKFLGTGSSELALVF